MFISLIVIRAYTKTITLHSHVSFRSGNKQFSLYTKRSNPFLEPSRTSVKFLTQANNGGLSWSASIIRSWNKPVLSNEVSCLRKQRSL